MKLQNRTLGLLVVAVLLLAAGVWFLRDFRPLSKKGVGPTDALSAAPESIMGPEAMGDPANADGSDNVDTKKVFVRLLMDARNCLGLPAKEGPEELAPTFENLQAALVSDLGPVQKQVDRWMAWHLRTPEGRERQLRLEVGEKDGVVKRELHHYAVDREGIPIPLESDPDQALNPSDETINQMLKEGDVFYKEKASEVFFAQGDRISFIEAGGGLSDFEIEHKGRRYHCPNIKNASTCSCGKSSEPSALDQPPETSEPLTN